MYGYTHLLSNIGEILHYELHMYYFSSQWPNDAGDV